MRRIEAGLFCLRIFHRFQISEPNSTNASPFKQVSNNVSQSIPAFDLSNILLEEPDYDTSQKLGRIQFSVSYDFESSTLTVRIIRAEELAAKDLSGTSDPYVKIVLLPDKKHTMTTNIKRKNLNPRWNEVFAFEGEGRFQCGIVSFETLITIFKLKIHQDFHTIRSLRGPCT